MVEPVDITSFKRAYKTVTEARLPDRIHSVLALTDTARYGENPNQSAAIYERTGRLNPVALEIVKDGKSGLSATNRMDAEYALAVIRYFKDPSVAVMKHLVPSGFATQRSDKPLDQLYLDARDTDARSAFGSVVALNRPLDLATAEAIVSSYVEVVVAPEYRDGTLDILSRKKNLRAVRFSGLNKLPTFSGDETTLDLRSLPTGSVLVQQPYLTSIKSAANLVLRPLVKKRKVAYSVDRAPTDAEAQELLMSWYVNIGVRSNGIVLVKDGVTLAVGTGQQERVGAVEQAVTKALQKAHDRKLNNGKESAMDFEWTPGGLSWDQMLDKLGYNPLEGAVASSDAFFPFRDSVDVLAQHDVTAVIQPMGSDRDFEIIQAVNEHGMAMPATLERCFMHF